MNVAVILAGGVGSRLGAKVPKQFVEVLGKPVLAYTIEAFDQHPEIDAVLVVCVRPWIDRVREMRERYGLGKLRWVTEGGPTFQESVLNGVRFLEGKVAKDDIVLFHFAASPFITGDIISDAIRVCGERGNAISTTDYLLLSGRKASTASVSDPENFTDEYIDRDTIAVMNAPHAFRYGFISDMYREAIETGVIDTVEPHTTTLMYAMGKPIYFSRGSQSNIKITRSEDLELFEGYVLERRRRAAERTCGDVVVFLADGFEECEGLLVVDILRRAGLQVVMASITGSREVESSRGVAVVADCLAEDADYDGARMIVLPGGRTGVENLGCSELVRGTCLEFARDKVVAAICAAPSILAGLGLLEGRKATVHPDFADMMRGAEVVDEPVVVDGNVVTGQGLGAAIPFSLELVRTLAGDEEPRRIAQAICYEG